MNEDRCPVCGNADRNRICHPNDAPTPDPLSDAPDHILDGLTCWCRPYPDREDPEVIIHRMEVKA